MGGEEVEEKRRKEIRSERKNHGGSGGFIGHLDRQSVQAVRGGP